MISLAGKDEITVKCGNSEYNVDIIAESKVASVFIETDSGSLDYIHEKKGNEEEGNISIIGADGADVEYAGRLEIKGRGNSTWNMEKKPYYITTAIAYASGKPHIGNTYEIVLTDAIARLKRNGALLQTTAILLL